MSFGQDNIKSLIKKGLICLHFFICPFEIAFNLIYCRKKNTFRYPITSCTHKQRERKRRRKKSALTNRKCFSGLNSVTMNGVEKQSL